VGKIQVETLTDIKAELGEGPLWSVEEQALYWIDVIQRKVFRYDYRTKKAETFAVSGMPGCIANREGGGIIAAFRTGPALIDLEKGQEQKLPSSIDFGKERFNDGKVDRRGRFFAGTMDKTMKEPIGGLYRIDKDHNVTRVADGICLSNGIAWSPDNRVLYHCESRPGLIYAYDYDIDTGTPTNRRVHIDFAQKGHHCDGCTVDAEGFLWVAEVNSGRIGRYAPDGRRVGEIEVPTSRVSSVMFGGPNLDLLFITTMYYNLKPEQLATQPLAGRLFVAQPGVKGLPEHPYAG
jgi:sugar lactone lactonase YvrE